ncbi:MAG: trypsin-like serine peptidase [Solirubrobacterales bacterium]
MRRAWAAVTLVLVASAVAAAGAQARPVVHDNEEARAEVLRYWTAARMKNAKPVERVSGRSPKARPGKRSSFATSVEVPLPYPSAHGKVFFTDSGVNYVCSGSAIVSSNESVVWTAGHCVNEGPGGFYTNFLFVPAYRDGAAPYGRFPGPTLLTTSGWQEDGEYGVDLGAAVVATNEAGQSLSDAVAERSLVFNSPRNQSYQLYGYPAAKRFNGQRMRVCNTAWSRNDTSTTPDTMGAPCNMTGGSSGGGWVTASGAVASVISYGYSSLKNVLFGPHQETEAQLLYTTAQTQ